MHFSCPVDVEFVASLMRATLPTHRIIELITLPKLMKIHTEKSLLNIDEISVRQIISGLS